MLVLRRAFPAASPATLVEWVRILAPLVTDPLAMALMVLAGAEPQAVEEVGRFFMHMAVFPWERQPVMPLLSVSVLVVTVLLSLFM